MPKVFISYRRDDSAGHAGRIYDHLMAHFGQGQVFIDVATAAAQAVLSSPSSQPQPYQTVTATAGLALVAVQKGDPTAAKEQYSTLESQSGLLVSWMPLSADRLLGLLAQTMGNLNQAAEHFEDALTFCRRADYRPEQAWTCCDYADTLLEHNDPDDRERAMSLLNESLAISTELGMRRLMERVLSRREILRA